MLRKLLESRMKENNLSFRQAGKEIGIAHTTVAAILNGATINLSTAEKISKWLGIKTTEAVGMAYDEDITSSVVALLQASPDLAAILKAAGDSVKSGEITQEDFEDIIEYAAFKLSRRKKNIGQDTASN